MSVLVVGLSHRSAPVELLERAAVGVDEIPKLLDEMLQGSHVTEVMMLSTCNRIEVYAVVDAFHGGLSDDVIYVADSESGSVNPAHGAWKRGIRIGSAKDGKVTAFIPDPNESATNTSAAEGVAVDARGSIYGAEVGPKALKKYVKP